jgi:hypothetical protein
MPYHDFSVTLEPQQEHQIEIGSGAPRIFLPAIENCSARRLMLLTLMEEKDQRCAYLKGAIFVR